MADRFTSASIEELPSDLIFEILITGQLSAVDLVCLELSSKLFGRSHGLDPHKFRSLVDFAAFHLCASHSTYVGMSSKVQKELFDRCNENWKLVLRFLQSSDMVQTSVGNMQITTGRLHTLLIRNSSVYSCGSSSRGVLGHGPETTKCEALTRINFPYAVHVTQVSATQNHSAFVLQSGEVFTCGDNSSYCCGHRDTNRPIFRPRLVEALNGVPCKQVAAGLNFTVFLTRQGHVYTCGSNTHGQLGHGDIVERATPTSIALLEEVGSVVQINAGPSYVLAVSRNGDVYSFGSGSNFCLGHGEQHNEFQPRVIQKFRSKGIHVVRVSAGDEHAVALDSSGFVYTWGKGYCGALGHGDEIDKTIPELLSSLKNHLAIQDLGQESKLCFHSFSFSVEYIRRGLFLPASGSCKMWATQSPLVCARKRKTFVLVDNGSVYGFGWSGFGSLGLTYDKVMKPRILDSLRGHHVSQISTGLYHTVVVTQQGRIFGFGDNERAQLGLDKLRGCLQPTEILIQEMEDKADLASASV